MLASRGGKLGKALLATATNANQKCVASRGGQHSDDAEQVVDGHVEHDEVHLHDRCVDLLQHRLEEPARDSVVGPEVLVQMQSRLVAVRLEVAEVAEAQRIGQRVFGVRWELVTDQVVNLGIHGRLVLVVGHAVGEDA